MSVYISLLRGINVGGLKRLPMDTLRGIYAGMGFTNVRTYVQSGNVVFDSLQGDRSVLVRQIEDQIEHKCGFHVEVFIRQAHDMLGILSNNPFLNNRNEDSKKLYVIFIYQPPVEAAWSRLTVPPNTTD